MHFSFNLLKIKGLYMFWALLTHPQEALLKRHLVYCVRMSVGCSTVPEKLQPCHSQLTLYARNIPNAVCAPPPEDEQLMLETRTGLWFSINWMKIESWWFHSTDNYIVSPAVIFRRSEFDLYIVGLLYFVCSVWCSWWTAVSEHRMHNWLLSYWMGFCSLESATWHFRHVCKIAKSYYWFSHVCPSVSLSPWNNSASTGRILIKFDTWVFFKNLSVEIKFH
jgi:hypothetical protein